MAHRLKIYGQKVETFVILSEAKNLFISFAKLRMTKVHNININIFWGVFPLVVFN